MYRSSAPRSPYDVLGVRSDASQSEIKKSYIALSRRVHPDKSGQQTDGDMAEINNAYDRLNTYQKRALLDSGSLVDWQGVDLSNFMNTGGVDILKFYFGDTLVQSSVSTGTSRVLKVFVHCLPDKLRDGGDILVHYSRQTLDQTKFNAMLSRRLKCLNCKGTGFIMQQVNNGSEKKKCRECRDCGDAGQFILEEEVAADIEIPADSCERWQCTVEGGGNHIENHEVGDVIFVFYADGKHPPKMNDYDQSVQVLRDAEPHWMRSFCNLL